MSEQIKFYSIILFMVMVLCCADESSIADAVQMQMMEQQVQQVPGEAVQIKPGQRDKVQSIQKPSAVPVLVQPGQIRRMQPGKMPVKIPGTMIVLPDLSINKFTISPQNINSGDQVKLAALIKNSGNQILHNVVVRFINMKTHMKLGEKRVTLTPGQVRQLIVTTSIKSLGSATVHSIIDPDNRIKESNERNNKAIAHVTVNMVDKVAKHKQQAKMKIGANGRQVATPMLPIPPPKQIGLSTSGLTTTLGNPPGGKSDFSCTVGLAGSTYGKNSGFHLVDRNTRQVAVQVTNNGGIVTKGFWVGLGISGKTTIGNPNSFEAGPKHWIPAGSIQPGKWTYASFKLPKTITENTKLIAAVDIEKNIQEVDEKNNYSKPFSIRFDDPVADLGSIKDSVGMNRDFHGLVFPNDSKEVLVDTSPDTGSLTQKLKNPVDFAKKIEGLKFTSWYIKNIIPKTVDLQGAYGTYARLSSIKVVIEYDVNRPFMFADSLKPPKGLGQGAVWSIAVPEIKVNAGLLWKYDSPRPRSGYFDRGIGDQTFVSYAVKSPLGKYPWETYYRIGSLKHLSYPGKVLPKGRHTITFELDEAGVIHGLRVVGFQTKWKRASKYSHRWKSYKVKCTQEFYPYFDVTVRIDTYAGAGIESSFSDDAGYGYAPDKPPFFQYLDFWKNKGFYLHKDRTFPYAPDFQILSNMCDK